MQELYISEEFRTKIWEIFCRRFHSEYSAAQYESDLRDLTGFCQKDFLKLTKEDVSRFFNELERRQKEHLLAPATAAKKMREYHALSCFVTDQFREDFPDYVNHFEDYMPSLAKIEKTVRTIPVRDIDDLLKAASSSRFDYAILVLMYRAGLTSTEVAYLRMQDILVYDNAVYLIVYKRENPVYLPEDCRDVLDSYLEVRPKEFPSDYIFYTNTGRQLYTMYISRMMKRLCHEAGISSVTAEALRNAGGVTMFAYGAPEQAVAQKLGITTIHIKRYKDYSYKERLVQAAENMVKIRVELPD